MDTSLSAGGLRTGGLLGGGFQGNLSAFRLLRKKVLGEREGALKQEAGGREGGWRMFSPVITLPQSLENFREASDPFNQSAKKGRSCQPSLLVVSPFFI